MAQTSFYSIQLVAGRCNNSFVTSQTWSYRVTSCFLSWQNPFDGHSGVLSKLCSHTFRNKCYAKTHYSSLSVGTRTKNNGLKYDQFMRPTISLQTRKLASILTKFVIKYLLRAFPSPICRYCNAQLIPKSCHKLSGDAYSHWHNISRYLEVFFEINFAKITPFEVHKSCSTLHELSDLFCKDFYG